MYAFVTILKASAPEKLTIHRFFFLDKFEKFKTSGVTLFAILSLKNLFLKNKKYRIPPSL